MPTPRSRPPGRSAAMPSPSSSTPPGSPTRATSGWSRLGLVGDERVRAAADDLLRPADGTASTSAGLLVEPMADPGVELIVGLRRDPSFGPAVMVGLGGVLAEVLDDVAIRLAPVTPARRWPCSTSCAARASSTACAAGRRSTAPPSPSSSSALVAAGRRAPRHRRGRPQPGHRLARRAPSPSMPSSSSRDGRRRRWPTPTRPVLVRRPRRRGASGSTLNRPAKLNALDGPLVADAGRRARRRRGRPATSGSIVLRGRGPRVLLRLRPDRGGRGRIGGPVAWRDAARRRRRRDAALPRLAEAGHRPGPRLRPGRRPGAGDGLRPGRRRRGHASSASRRSATGRRRSRCSCRTSSARSGPASCS